MSQIICRARLKPWPCWSQCNFSVCWVRSGFSWKHFLVAKITAVRKRDGLLFSGKGKPPNHLGKQVILKYRITFLSISTLLKHTISTKRHQFHFYINNLLRDLWGKHTASGKCQSTEQMLKAVRGLYGDYIHSIFQEYMYILSLNSISWWVSISLWALRFFSKAQATDVAKMSQEMRRLLQPLYHWGLWTKSFIKNTWRRREACHLPSCCWHITRIYKKCCLKTYGKLRVANRLIFNRGS